MKNNVNLRNNFKFKDIILLNFINLSDDEKKLVLTWRNHESIRKWMYTDRIITPTEHDGFIKTLKSNNKDYYWLIENNDIYSGVIYLNKVSLKNKNAYIGIYSNPKIKGAGKWLMDTLLKLAFDVTGLHTLKLEVLEDNLKAINFYKKSGFAEEGRLKEFILKDNIKKDVIIMGITASKVTGEKYEI